MNFMPEVITVEPGPVILDVHNVSRVPHDLLVPDLNASTGNINGGSSGTVALSLDQPGTYPFICTYHELVGMTGQIVVLEPPA